MKYQPDDNPFGSKRATVNISKNKVLLRVFFLLTNYVKIYRIVWIKKKFCIIHWTSGCACEAESEGFEKILRKRISSVLVLQGLSVAFEIIIWIYSWERTNQVIQQVNKTPYMSISLETFKNIDEYLGLFILCRPITL